MHLHDACILHVSSYFVVAIDVSVGCVYFQLKQSDDMLSHLYTDFDKTKFAGMCRELAAGMELCTRVQSQSVRIAIVPSSI